jgi:IclR family transcriptional regulator, acetate operon repressor
LPVGTDPSRKTNPDRSQLQSVQRAVRVLEVIAASHGVSTVSDIANAVELERTIVHRILRTLQDAGLVVKADGRYKIGVRGLLLGNAYLEHLALRRVALPYVQNLLYIQFRDHPWAITLFVPAGRFVAVVNQLFTPDSPFDLMMEIGTSFLAQDTAAGRAIVAYLPEYEAEQLLGAAGHAELAPRLEQIRAAEGVDSNVILGMTAVSAVIRDSAGYPVGALTLSGYDVGEHRATVDVALRRAAAAIGAAL